MAELTNAAKLSQCINESSLIFYYEAAVFLIYL